MKNKFTIKDLREGNCVLKNDGTLEELMYVLKEAFPNDPMTPAGTSVYYYRLSNNKLWGSSQLNLKNNPEQSVKDFIPYLSKDKPKSLKRKLVRATLKSLLTSLQWENKDIGTVAWHIEKFFLKHLGFPIRVHDVYRDIETKDNDGIITKKLNGKIEYTNEQEEVKDIQFSITTYTKDGK